MKKYIYEEIKGISNSGNVCVQNRFSSQKRNE